MNSSYFPHQSSHFLKTKQNSQLALAVIALHQHSEEPVAGRDLKGPPAQLSPALLAAFSSVCILGGEELIILKAIVVAQASPVRGSPP